MSIPRVLIVFALDERVSATVLAVRSPEDAQRLRRELSERATIDEIREALSAVWDELTELARETP